MAQPPRSEAQPARSEAQPARSEAQPARSEAQPARSEAQPARSEAQPARSEAQPAKLQASGLAVWASGHAGWPGGGNGQTDRQTNRKSLHSTGLCPLSGPLPCFPSCKPRKCLFKIKVKQGKGTPDHLMPLGYLFQLKRSLSTNISQPVINLKFTC